ncbi:MAG: DNA primase [Brevinema sp.]
MIPQDVIDDILRRVSLVEVMSQYITLKKSGHAYKGLCPFHNDRNNPSLHVDDQKGLYHCFSCKAGGNILTFLKEYNKLDFIDSMKFLEPYSGIDIEPYLKQQQDTFPLRNKLKTMHQIAQDFFQENLYKIDNPQVELAVRTIKKRKLDKKTISLFGLGFGGVARNELFQKLQNSGFKAEEIFSSGLCGKSEQGTIYDRFRNRITFPICDSEGIVIAFGARIIDNSSPAKYINSPETLLFKKGSVLYAWHLAKESVLESGELILVEGYLDVIRMFQAGFTNTVAPMGTGLTEEQVYYIKNKIDNLIFCFDGDNAGQKSSYRSAGIAAKLEVPTKIAILPENDDPDTFLLQQGANAMADILQNSQDAEKFILESATKHLPDSNKFLQEVFEYAIFLEGEDSGPSLNIRTNQFLKKTATLLSISYSSIELEFSRYKQHYSKDRPIIDKQQYKEFEEEFELMAILVMFPEFADHAASIVSVLDFFHQETKEIFTQILMHPEKTAQEWLITIGKTDLVSYTSKWLEAPDIRIIQNYAVSLRIKSLKRKRTLINQELFNYLPDSEKHHELSTQIIELQQELINLKKMFYLL